MKSTLLEQRAPDLAPTAGPAPGLVAARTAGLVAGAGILLMAALAGFGNLVVLEGLITPGDPAGTADDLMASEGVFRLGVAAMYGVVLLDVLVAWALYRFLSPVDRGLSRLAAWFRLAYAAVFLAALSQLAGVPGLLGDDAYASAFGTEQLQAQAMLKVDAFHDLWFAALLLFGAHLAIIGYLAFRSGYVPRVIGTLLMVAGAGYAFDTFSAVLSQGSPFAISTVTFFGELLLAVWLVVRARKISWEVTHHGA